MVVRHFATWPRQQRVLQAQQAVAVAVVFATAMQQVLLHTPTADNKMSS
jgi:hypothetical protein